MRQDHAGKIRHKWYPALCLGDGRRPPAEHHRWRHRIAALPSARPAMGTRYRAIVTVSAAPGPVATLTHR